MKATEHLFHMVLFVILCEVFLTVESADETLVCDHSNVVQGGLNFRVWIEN